MNRISIVAGASALALAPLAHAIPDITGMMGNHPAGLLVGSQASANSVVIRDAGAVTGAPEEWTASAFGAASSTHPDFSNAKLTQNMWPGVEFHSMTTGFDIIPGVLSDGRMLLTGNVWFALDVTVASTATGTQGSPIRRMANLGGAEASIFSYTAEGSGGLAAGYEDKAMIEQTARQVGLVGALPEIRGLDWGMGVEAANATGGIPMFLPSPYVYFSVSPDFVASTIVNGQSTVFVPNPETGAPEPLNSATIYRTEWDTATAPLEWSSPEIFVSFLELGLVPFKESIDGLSLTRRNGLDRIIFSTGPDSNGAGNAPVRDQIQVFERDSTQQLGTLNRVTVQTQPLRTGGGTNFSTKVGLNPPKSNDPDNVLGLCGRDPEAGGDLNRSVAIPKYYQSSGPGSAPTMGVAVSRRHVQTATATSNRFHLEASGFDFKGHSSGAILFELGVAAAPTNGLPLPQPPLAVYEVVVVPADTPYAVPATAPSLETGLLAYVQASFWLETSAGTWIKTQQSAVHVIVD